MVHRTATSESESGVESNWGTSVTHDDDVTCDGNSEGHSVFDGGDETADDGIEDGTNVSQRSMSVVTLGDDTLQEDMGLDSDTTLDCSDGDEDAEPAEDADDTRKTHGSGSKSSGDEGNALDPSFMYMSKIYVTLSGSSDQSDLSMQEAVSVNSDSERQSVTRQTSLFDELQQAEDRLSLKVNILEGDAGGSDCVDTEMDELPHSEATVLEVCGLIKDEGDEDTMCCQEDSVTVLRESDPSGGLANVRQSEESKNADPNTADECAESLDMERMSCDEVSMKIGIEDEECVDQRDESRAMEHQGSFDIAADLSYEDSFEDSVRDNDTEYCCAASSELSESETTGVYNVAAYPECTESTVGDDQHQADELRLDLARDIMTDDGSVASEVPSDWMEASMNSLIASANRDWVQQNVLSESAQSRNEEFAALQKALMLRTIQCVVSEQLSRGSASSETKPDEGGYLLSSDDVSRKLTGSDELLHLLDMIGVQGQEMRKELVMSQSREAYLQEEMTNDDEQLIEVVDVLQQELSVVKEDNLRLHNELMHNEVVRSEYVQEVGSLKGVVRRLCGHIEHLEVEVKKMHSDMTPRQVTKNASTLIDAPCRFNFAMQTECDMQSTAKVTVRNADCQMVSHVETVDGCCQTERESGLFDDACQNDSAERMSNNVTTMIDKILQQMAHMTGRSISATTMTYSDEADGDYVWQANDECDSSEATVQVMKQHLANAMLQYDLTKSELERKNDALQQEVESSSSCLCDTERELTKAREQNDLLKVLTEGDKAEMDILKDKIAMMDKAVSAAQIVNDRLTLRLDATLNEVSMMTPAQEAELKDKMAALETDKKQVGQVRQNVYVRKMIFFFFSPGFTHHVVSPV